jgi:hypothetical protein
MPFFLATTGRSRCRGMAIGLEAARQASQPRHASSPNSKGSRPALCMAGAAKPCTTQTRALLVVVLMGGGGVRLESTHVVLWCAVAAGEPEFFSLSPRVDWQS